MSWNSFNIEEVFALHACGSCNWFNSNAVFGNACMSSEENGWDDYFTELNFFNNFPAGVRKNVTFQTTITKPDDTTIPWQNTSVKHPYYAKEIRLVLSGLLNRNI